MGGNRSPYVKSNCFPDFKFLIALSRIVLIKTDPFRIYPFLNNLDFARENLGILCFLPAVQRFLIHVGVCKEMANNAKTSSFTAKGLLQTPELYEYVLNTSVFPREAQLLKELRDITSNHPLALMGTAPDAGQFITLLLNVIKAKKTIEIGVFTGYSLLLTALNIPDDGKITAIDINRSAYELGLPVIKKAGVEHKINYIESEALPVLNELLKDPENKESFDFAFVDADKVNYSNYHERLLELLKPGGIVVYDNTLWGGSVAMPEGMVPESFLATRDASIEFNKYLANDTRVQISLVPLGDGITICHRL